MQIQWMNEIEGGEIAPASQGIKWYAWPLLWKNRSGGTWTIQFVNLINLLWEIVCSLYKVNITLSVLNLFSDSPFMHQPSICFHAKIIFQKQLQLYF